MTRRPSRRLSRRRFLGLAGAAGAVGLVGTLPGCSLLAEAQPGRLLPSAARLPAPYGVPLPVPKVLRPRRRTADADHYEIVARDAEVEILPGLRTRIMGYDGTFPGPTIVSRRGRRTVVRHVNRLSLPYVVHLHGGHTPPASDGFATDLVLPEGYDRPGLAHGMTGNVVTWSRRYVYPMEQRAATLWYHDHRMDFTAPQVWHGLVGLHLVHDDEEDALPLPRGERDLPLVIADRSFDGDGTFLYPAVDPTLRRTPGVTDAYMDGVLGDVILVNGAPWPEHEVTATRHRLRLLNASNVRRYLLRLDPPPPGGKGLVQVGSDGGLLAAPVAHDDVRLAPAERCDVVVDFSRYRPGTTVTLTNAYGSGGTARVMRFRVGRRAKDDARVPARLAEVEPLRASASTVTRDFHFSRGRLHGGHAGWTVNGRPFDPDRAETVARLGRVERWRFTTDLHHPVHVHLDPFQVQGAGEWDHGWKDTVDVAPSSRVEVLVRFADHAGKYLIHCHNLEHEDMGMMAAFRTI